MLSKRILSEYNQTRVAKNKEVICYAPFASLNFEQTGNGTACCYNRKQVLGTYPQHSIKEMWSGQSANELRDYILQKKLKGGCEVCLKQLESKNYYGTRARYFDNYSDSYKEKKSSWFSFGKQESKYELQMPRLIEFELSNTCNLECVMCTGYFSSSIRKNREKLPPTVNPYDLEFVRQLEEFIPHLQDAKFLGGEPFLIDIYYEIWDAIRKINPDITIHITTNATILNNRAKTLLESLKCGIIMSIDSVNKDTYLEIRKNANFERVMENFHYFRDYTKRKNTWLSFAVCPMTSNWHELPDIIQFCNEYEVSVFFNTVFRPESHSLRFQPAFVLKNILEEYKKVSLPSGKQVEEQNKKCFEGFVHQVENWYNDKVQQETGTPEINNKIAFATTADLPNSNSKDAVTNVLQTLVKYYQYKKTFDEEKIAQLNGNASTYLNQLIAEKQLMFLQLDVMKQQLGHDDYLGAFLDGLQQFHTVMNQHQADKNFLGKTKEAFQIIQQHPQKKLIIDEIHWWEPVSLLCILQYMTVPQIRKMYDEAY